MVSEKGKVSGVGRDSTIVRRKNWHDPVIKGGSGFNSKLVNRGYTSALKRAALGVSVSQREIERASY